ncbi:MAG: DUF4358 domain-containing protein [Mogibacterium sp.]|nr:DUF4358 domain-containing protein [Mogibacterium sp.]
MEQESRKAQSQSNIGRFAANLFKLVLIGVLAAFLVLVYGRADAKDADIAEINAALQEQTEITSLQECSARDLLQFLGIDANNYDSFLYYKSGEALGVEEVLILKARNKDELPAARNAVQDRIDSQIRAYEGYGPEQVKMLGSAVVILRGSFLFYCTAPDTEPYEEVFRNAV